ncbi:hypothetical protein ACQ4PT_070808 [Festuca glaucescens]
MPRPMSLTRGAVRAVPRRRPRAWSSTPTWTAAAWWTTRGAAINGDRLIALISAIVLGEHPGTTVVTDARAGDGLTRFIEARGGKHCLYRVGLPQRDRQGRAAQRRRRRDARHDGDHRTRRASRRTTSSTTVRTWW